MIQYLHYSFDSLPKSQIWNEFQKSHIHQEVLTWSAARAACRSHRQWHVSGVFIGSTMFWFTYQAAVHFKRTITGYNSWPQASHYAHSKLGDPPLFSGFLTSLWDVEWCLMFEKPRNPYDEIKAALVIKTGILMMRLKLHRLLKPRNPYEIKAALVIKTWILMMRLKLH